MARTKQYVVYTREFSKGRVNSKVGVFIDEAKTLWTKKATSQAVLSSSKT